MPALHETLRKQLEKTVIAARDIAEDAATEALKGLAVDQAKPFGHMTPDERELRNKLRAKARQLGDRLSRPQRNRHPERSEGSRTGVQTIDHLVTECAYEHWHRMLFARFLAENHLLIHDEEGVPVSLEECEELAKDEGIDGWTLAARFASRMLPQIFRPDDPVLAVTLAPESKRALEKMLDTLPPDVFTADDSLGWVYQFWQDKRKDEVNASGVKIGADELPAVTQLFTEHYMVLFLLHNTLGAWWAGKVLQRRAADQSRDCEGADTDPARNASSTRHPERSEASQTPNGDGDTEILRFAQNDDGCAQNDKGELSEEQWRRRVALSGCDFEYLRFLPDGTPAAGTFSGWPTDARNLRILDPCCGSGHFLVAAFDLMVRIRMKEEGLSPRDACDAVLCDNIFGLEIDQRCTQIAAFALALAAWKFPSRHPERSEGSRPRHPERSAHTRHAERSEASQPPNGNRDTEILRSAQNDSRSAQNDDGFSPGYRELPELHIACSGIAPHATEEQWLELAEQSSVPMPAIGKQPIREGLRNLHALFSQAPTLGSLIDPNELPGDLIAADYETLQPYLAAALAAEKADDETHERAVAAAGMVKAAELLAGEYSLVITNVPYLGRGKQHDVLKKHLEKHYKDGKADLATAFVLRCLEFCQSSRGFQPLEANSAAGSAAGSRSHYGSTALVTPQNWLFLTTYKKLRTALLKQRTWKMVARLGPGAFETIGGHVVNVALIAVSATPPAPDARMAGIDVSSARQPDEKAALLRGLPVAPPGLPPTAAEVPLASAVGPLASADGPLASVDGPLASADGPLASVDGPLASVDGSPPAEKATGRPGNDVSTPQDGPADAGEAPAPPTVPPPKGQLTSIPQAEQLKNPDATVSFTISTIRSYLYEYAGCYQGLTTADDGKWRRQLWEVPAFGESWLALQTPSQNRGLFSGREDVVARSFIETDDHTGVIRGRDAWGKSGVAIDRVGSLARAIYEGDLFHSLVPVVVAHKQENQDAIAAFCFSDDFTATARESNQSLSVDNGYLGKIPFDLAHWQKVAAEKYPDGLPEPESDDPTQWLFHGRPEESTAPLQVAVARLLGYRWPAELDATMRLSKQARGLVQRCEELLRFADDDGIVCIPAVRGERTAADRVRELLAAAYSSGRDPGHPERSEGSRMATRNRDAEILRCAQNDGGCAQNDNRCAQNDNRCAQNDGGAQGGGHGEDWSPAKQEELLASVGYGGKSLDEWLRDGFFEQHCKLFHNRPFIWHIWDGRKKDGFGVLINYHMLDAKLLDRLIYTYLGDWIKRQEQAVAQNESGADARLLAAQQLQEKLKLIAEGEGHPNANDPKKSYGYDIFVRWKPLEEQPIGWNPDLNDGVRMNIRPFMEANILRKKPNIKWKKDRGKEPQRPRDQYPWFYDENGEPTGDRVNDVHLTNAERQAAREKAEQEASC